ncbi:MAG: hypothetical protein KH415_21920 [Clostridium sp.]|nr:hypothetical protein [Clostridium sp.]
MNREEALQRAIELKEHSQEFESVSFIDDDTEFFEYVIKELERTAPEVPVQEQLGSSITTRVGKSEMITTKSEITLKIDSSEIAKVVIDELRNQQKQSEIRIISV